MSEGFDVTDPFEIDDLSDQTGSELLPASKGVKFSVKDLKAESVNKKDTGEWLMNKLRLQASIGALGVDGEGKYANKVCFGDLIATFNTERYTSDWWKKQARFPTRSFLQALGYDPKELPKVDDEFLEAQKGKEFLADIIISPIQAKNEETGKWEDTGERKNELRNFKKAEA